MRKFTTIALIMCLLLVITSCSKGAEVNEDVPASGENLQPIETQLPESEPPQAEPEILCSLTGLPIEEEQRSVRPIAVMIDNMASARPQSGLAGADIVYEMPAEGGITRYLAIYHHQDVEKIGPVRSARSYFIDKAMEFNAVYIHCGGSPEALKDIQTLKVDSLDDLKGARNFWRARDRKAPHNLYTSTKLAREVMDTNNLSGKKWNFAFNFNDDFLAPDGKITSNFVIDYKQNYKVGYEYDGKGVYYRLVNGIRLKDKETGAEITTTNILVEKVSVKVSDDAGRLDVSNIGTGRGYFLTGGKLIEIQWSKENRNGKTQYTDLKGNPIKLNKGKTWIQVVPDYATIEIKE